VPYAEKYRIFDYGYIDPQRKEIPKETVHKWVSDDTSRTILPKAMPGIWGFKIVAYSGTAPDEEFTSESEMHFVDIVPIAGSVDPETLGEGRVRESEASFVDDAPVESSSDLETPDEEHTHESELRHVGDNAVVGSVDLEMPDEEHICESEARFVGDIPVENFIELEAPSFGLPNTALTIRWNPIRDTPGYILEWAYNEKFSKSRFIRRDQPVATLTVDMVGVVCVRVRPEPEIVPDYWSKPAKVMICPERPTIVTSVISGRGSLLTWHKNPYADRYAVEWSEEDFISSTDSYSLETEEDFALIPFPGFFARVKAINRYAGVDSQWSDTHALPSYEVECVAIIQHPMTYSRAGKPVVIEWTFPENAPQVHDPLFEVQISKSEDFTNPKAYPISAYSVALDFEDEGMHFARVRFMRDGYSYGWSKPAKIVIQNPTTDGFSNGNKLEQSQFEKSSNRPRFGQLIRNIFSGSKED
jgi:hypothetical protein